MYMNDEQLRRLDIARAKYSQQEKKDLIREYSELRQLLGNPYATMKVYVYQNWTTFTAEAQLAAGCSCAAQ